MASPSTSMVEYDVFINHRGPDVKKTFASHLYHRLRAHGLRVFLDQEELQEGDNFICQIEGAIKAASVHIAIFSTNYAQSHWCLDELLLILKSKRKSGSTIIPIFYNVKPSELRWTETGNGVYAQALRILEEKITFDSQICQNKLRYDSDTVGKWKQALSDVADISGFELEKYNGRDEGLLLVDVVERVLEIVPKTPLYVSKYPSGLDDKVKEFEETVVLRQHQNGKARVVGILGIGGIGKTTLAKQFFNSKRSHYPRSCFLSDVRENSLKSLQTELLKALTRFSEQINSIAEGTEKLRRYFSSSHALIVLDDVDHIDQLEALISPANDVLSSSSLILVTSRNKEVLTSWGIGDLSIYRLKGLNSQYSTELFCWYAFHQPHPVAGFEQAVNEFLNPCNGLPLSLRVIGALLFGKNLEYWKKQLSKISKILPTDIQKTLKISYDSLDEEEKQIFLDIACFFIGEDKDTAIRIWNGCGWSGSLGLQKLDDKCLVEFHRKKCTLLDPVLEVDGRKCIKMHDHLRDLGRSLAEKEPRCRLWGRDFDFSPNLPVRGITSFAQCSPSVSYMSDGQLRRLELLSAQGSVDNVFRVGHSPQLIWLHWINCPCSSLPSMIPLQNLRVLCIKGSKLKTPWQPESEVPLQLRELHIATDDLLKIPKSIGKLKHLKKIVLEPNKTLQTMRLETLPPEFHHLQSLNHLELRRCSNLNSLPHYFCRLTNLQHINLYECSDLQMLPDDFGKLTKLRHLRLSHSQLHTFPVSFANLTNLQCIDLKFTKFREIPDSFAKLTNLQHLDLSHCSRLKMVPSSLENLTNLKYVDLSHCSRLEMIPASWWRKKKLKLRIKKCPRLEKRPLNKAATFNINNNTLALRPWKAATFNVNNNTLPLRPWFSKYPFTFYET